MKKLIYLSLVLTLTIVITSCSKETNNNNEIESPLKAEENVISSEIISKLSLLNFNTENAKLVSNLVNSEEYYSVENDIQISKSFLDNLNLTKNGGKANHYSVNSINLVTTPTNGQRIIKIRVKHRRGFTGKRSRFSYLGDFEYRSFTEAVAQFNNLNLSIKFQLSKGLKPENDTDIFVYRTRSGVPEGGGAAALSSNGNPGSYIKIHYDVADYNNLKRRHVYIHELGHAIGLRHTDWQNHESCSSSSGESSYNQASHINGTPTGYDPTSIMLTCGFGANGSLNSNDILALRNLY